MNRILVLSLLFVCFFSCNEHETECYDPLVASVLEKKTVYENITRQEWLSLPDSLKRPVYFVMSPDARFLFWQDRMSEIVSLSWSKEEREHIESLHSYINSNSWLFVSEPSENDSVNLFFDRWINNGKKDFGWTDNMVYFLVATGTRVTNSMLSDLKKGINLSDPIDDVDHYCSCSQTSDFCFGDKKCNGEICTNTVDGCGLFWLYKCTGRCREK